MNRRSKNFGKPVSTQQSNGDKRLIIDKVRTSTGEEPTVSAAYHSLANIVEHKTISETGDNGMAQNASEGFQDEVEADGPPEDEMATRTRPTERVIAESSHARLTDLVGKMNLDSHFGQPSVSPKDSENGSDGPRPSVPVDLNHCKFETDIDEASLKSFLDLPTLPEVTDEFSIGHSALISQRNDEAYEKEEQHQSYHMERRPQTSSSASSSGRIKMIRNIGKQTAQTSHQMLGKLLQNNTQPEDTESLKENSQQMIPVETKESQSQGGEGKVPLSHTSESVAVGDVFRCFQEDKNRKTSFTSGMKPRAQELGITSIIRNEGNNTQSLSTTKGSKVEHEGTTSLVEGVESSQKTESKESRNSTGGDAASSPQQSTSRRRTHDRSGTRNRCETVILDSKESRHSQKEHRSHTTRSLTHHRKACNQSRQREAVPGRKGKDSPSRNPVTGTSKSKAKSETSTVSIRERNTFSSTGPVVTDSGRWTSETKRQRESFKGNSSEPSRPPSKDGRNSRRIRRHTSSKENQIGPIIISAKDGICLNEEAFIQLENRVAREISNVMNAVEDEIQRVCHSKKGKKSRKFIFFSTGK